MVKIFNGINIVKQVFYGAEAGGNALAKTVYKYMSQDGKDTYNTITRTVLPDAKYGTRAIWSQSNAAQEKCAQYTNRTRQVYLKRWFGTDSYNHELDNAGKYLTKQEFAWTRTHNPVSMEEYSRPYSGSRLDLFEENQYLHYVNGELYGVHKPVQYKMPHYPINY